MLETQLWRFEQVLEHSVMFTVACVAVVSVSFLPSGTSAKDARGHWAKRILRFSRLAKRKRKRLLRRLCLQSYNQRQKCWEGCLFFSPLPPHPLSFKVAVNATTKLSTVFCMDVFNIGFGGEGAIKSVARALN